MNLIKGILLTIYIWLSCFNISQISSDENNEINLVGLEYHTSVQKWIEDSWTLCVINIDEYSHYNEILTAGFQIEKIDSAMNLAITILPKSSSLKTPGRVLSSFKASCEKCLIDRLTVLLNSSEDIQFSEKITISIVYTKQSLDNFLSQYVEQEDQVSEYDYNNKSIETSQKCTTQEVKYSPTENNQENPTIPLEQPQIEKSGSPISSFIVSSASNAQSKQGDKSSKKSTSISLDDATSLGLCHPVTHDESIDVVNLQNSFFLPDILYIETAIMIRRIAKRMDIQRSAEESVSIILAGLGGLILSDTRCEESMRSSMILGELVIPGVGLSDLPPLCNNIQSCLENEDFHNSVLSALSKAYRYINFVKDRNREYMWETMVRMTGSLGNVKGLQAYRLWLELENMIALLDNDIKVLHSDIPNDVMGIPEYASKSEAPTVECTIALMRVGAPFDIRLTQITDAARACNQVMKDQSTFLSVNQVKVITDTLLLARIADWFVGTFIVEKHIPPAVTRPAACLYLSSIISPMNYSSLIQYVWPRIVFAIASAAPSALSFSTRTVDPENCRKALSSVIKVLGDKLPVNIDETCGKMAACIARGRIARVNIDETISNVLKDISNPINYDSGTNSAALRLTIYTFGKKAPSRSRRRSFSYLSTPLRAAVLYGHLQSLMPGGFSVDDVLKMIYEFTKGKIPNGPAERCFVELMKSIPVFLATDAEIKLICVKALGPWIMPDITLSDVPISTPSPSYSRSIVV
ncbi:hypothetical protein ACR3K2_27380 [Cryptosporidium serpentis]